MINRLPSWFLVVILALLLVLPFWLNQSPRAISPAQYSQLSRTPDYVVENLSVIQMDEGGVGRHVLLAKKMVHYPDDDSTDFEQPRLINTEPGKPAMQVKADEAKMTSSGEDIYLSGNVVVLRNAGKGRGETRMTTSMLHVIPDDDIARTDKPIVINEKNAVIRAVGMETSNRTGITQLLSQVKVEHGKRR